MKHRREATQSEESAVTGALREYQILMERDENPRRAAKLRSQLADQTPAVVLALEARYIGSVPAPCGGASMGTPTTNLAACQTICELCFHEVIRGLRYILEHLDGPEPGPFLDPRAALARSGMATLRSREKEHISSRLRARTREIERQFREGREAIIRSHLDPTDEAIIKLFGSHKGRLMTAEVARRLDLNGSSIGKNLAGLKKKGLLENPGRSGYAITEKGSLIVGDLKQQRGNGM